MTLQMRHYLEELENIVANGPVHPGDTISHETARVCEIRNWTFRDRNGDWLATAKGRFVNQRHSGM